MENPPPYNPQGYQAQGYQAQGYAQQPPGYSSTVNNTTTVVVQAQPQVVTTSTLVPVVYNYMGLSIFACLLCCWPIGIFAILKSSESSNHYLAGDYAGAVSSAQTARNLSYAAICCGITIFVIVIISVSV